jgi:hypothetical protein
MSGQRKHLRGPRFCPPLLAVVRGPGSSDARRLDFRGLAGLWASPDRALARCIPERRGSVVSPASPGNRPACGQLLSSASSAALSVLRMLPRSRRQRSALRDSRRTSRTNAMGDGFGSLPEVALSSVDGLTRPLSPVGGARSPSPEPRDVKVRETNAPRQQHSTMAMMDALAHYQQGVAAAPARSRSRGLIVSSHATAPQEQAGDQHDLLQVI